MTRKRPLLWACPCVLLAPHRTHDWPNCGAYLSLLIKVSAVVMQEGKEPVLETGRPLNPRVRPGATHPASLSHHLDPGGLQGASPHADPQVSPSMTEQLTHLCGE